MSRVAARVRDACEEAGLVVVATHPPTWGTGFRRQWRAAFGFPEADWARARLEWELLGTHVAPAKARQAAVRELELRRSEARRFFVAVSLDDRDVFEVEGAFPDHAWWRAAARHEDLYVVHGDWLWSFVLTHEETMGIGPFFVEALADGEGGEPNLRQQK